MIEVFMKKPQNEPTNRELLEVMQASFSNMEHRIVGIEQDVRGIKVTLSDLQENFEALSVAFDRDAETLVDHAQRIERLEEVA
jgi:hypothetical protein